MTKFKKLIASKTPFRRALTRWYDRNARDLPWRGSTNPYAIWVSEIVLQQTRVDQGTPYIQRFLKTFPTVRRLAQASEDEVLKLWEGLGYYARGRNLHKAAQVIVRDRDGILPDTVEGWQALPGIGRYTAGAITSIAFDEPAPVLDGNVKRVLSRLTDLNASIDDVKTQNDLWGLAGKLVQGKRPGTFNQGLMELGAQLCKPKAPRCEDCPVQTFCAARAAGTQSKRPLRKAKPGVPHHEIVVAAIAKNGRYLLGKRPPGGLLGGLWEFPGGKVETGESHTRALKRELREELGIHVTIGDHIATIRHAYSHFKITLSAYRCTHKTGKPQPKAHAELKWVQPARFDEFAFPKANHKFLHLL